MSKIDKFLLRFIAYPVAFILGALLLFQVSRFSYRQIYFYGKQAFESFSVPEVKKEFVRFCVISPTYNSKDATIGAIKSVMNQKYISWHMHITDDNSPDGTFEHVSAYLKQNNIQEEKISIIKNKVNQGALKNVYEAIYKHCSDEEIVVILDGDDALYGKYAFDKLYRVYEKENPWIVGSNHFFLSNKKMRTPSFYSKEVMDSNSFRGEKFSIIGLVSFRTWLFKKVQKQDMLDEKGEFYKIPKDVILFFPMMEMASKGRVLGIDEPLQIYNNVRTDNDQDVRRIEQMTLHRKFVFKPRYAPLETPDDAQSYLPPIDSVSPQLGLQLLIDFDKIRKD